MEKKIKEQLIRIKHVALDMDGTIYMGNSIFPYTIPFLEKLDGMGISYSFLTNNPSKSIDDYLKKLSNMGIHATEEEIYNTTIATIDYIHTHYPKAKKLFLLGTPSMISQFEKAGFISTSDDPDDLPDIIVAAFDMTLSYSRLCRAAWWISQGLPYIATNPDRVCPTNERTILVDCGSICRCLESATGRKPDITLGKPDPNMLVGIRQQKHLQAEEIAMVGDRIYTDIAMAFNANALGCLVLSGETTLEVAKAAPRQPDLIVENIWELGQLLEEARKH
ncbi:MAG: HAD-IIA family hydrolase [Bacteroidaceae bacterium]|nr:HAD-IIA family hydrolase [Bacteroidaceae bacterium]